MVRFFAFTNLIWFHQRNVKHIVAAHMLRKLQFDFKNYNCSLI